MTAIASYLQLAGSLKPSNNFPRRFIVVVLPFLPLILCCLGRVVFVDSCALSLSLSLSPKMATTPRKPGTPKSSISENQTATVNGSSSPPRSHTRSPSASTNGLTRTPSGRSTPVSARAAARKPGRSNLSMTLKSTMIRRRTPQQKESSTDSNKHT